MMSMNQGGEASNFQQDEVWLRDFMLLEERQVCHQCQLVLPTEAVLWVSFLFLLTLYWVYFCFSIKPTSRSWDSPSCSC